MDDVLTIASSGLHSAQVRMRNSAHNVANLATQDFHNHRTLQTQRAGGGSVATTRMQAVNLPSTTLRRGMSVRQSISAVPSSRCPCK